MIADKPIYQKAILISLVLIAADLAVQLSGSVSDNWYGWLSWCVAGGCLFFSTKLYMKTASVVNRVAGAIANGVRTSFYTGLIMLVYTFISLRFFFPGFVDRVVHSLVEIEKQRKNLSVAQINAMLPGLRHFSLITLLATAFFGEILAGAAGSVAAALYYKKDRRSVN